jgi:hypothetical protein
MKLNSTTLGTIILLVIFGGIAASASMGFWQTEGGEHQNRAHGGEAGDGSHTTVTLRGIVNGYDLSGLSLTTGENQSLYIQLGPSHYNQSIGFAPQVGEGVTVTGFIDHDGLFSAMTVILNSTGVTHSFRDAGGHPLWPGGNGNGGHP